MTLQHEMERLGRILAFDRNLQVDVRGTRAYSVPGRIVIPNAETYAHLGANAERMLHGLLDHECGHARYTDHSYMERARKKGGEGLAALLNALEDGRIERLMGEEYVGCKQNLHRKNRWFWEDAEWQKNFRTAEVWAAFCTAATLYVRGGVTLAEIAAVRPEVADLLRAADQHGLNTFHTLRTVQEVYELAVALWERFCSPPPPPSTPESSGAADSDGDSSSDDAVGDAENSSGQKGRNNKARDQKAAGGSAEADAEENENEAEEDEDEGEGREASAEGRGARARQKAAESPENADSSSSSDGSEADSEGLSASGDSDDAVGSEDEENEAEGEGGSKDGDGTIDPYRAVRGLRLQAWKGSAEVVDPEKAIARLMERAYENKDGIYRVFSHEFDLVRDFYAQPSKTMLERPEQIERDACIASAALAQAFEVALKARRERRPISGNDEGEVDLDLLAEFSVGSAPADTIFCQWVAEDDRDVAVAIMLDCSASMRSSHGKQFSRDHLARRVAYALHLALSACAIEHEITGFTTVSSGDYEQHLWAADMPRLAEHFARMRAALHEAHAHGVDPNLFARELWRWERGSRRSPYGDLSSTAMENVLRAWPLLVPVYAVFKPFGASDARWLTHAAGIHENLDGEAVLWQARRLAARPEKRRVMFVLSDGLPSGARDSNLGAKFLKECVQRVIAAGIEVYGIGIETDAVKNFYPRYWVANSVEHLMEVAFESFASVITEGRMESQCVAL